MSNRRKVKSALGAVRCRRFRSHPITVAPDGRTATCDVCPGVVVYVRKAG